MKKEVHMTSFEGSGPPTEIDQRAVERVMYALGSILNFPDAAGPLRYRLDSD